MSDDSLETLTSIEAKVLRMRYGINNLDERHSLRVLRIRNGVDVTPHRSASEIARTLGEDTDVIQKTETNALRKLRAFN